MSKSAISVLVFAVYLLVLGIILLFEPNPLLALFGIPATNEVWIRVVGMLVCLLSFYYFQAVRRELTEFFRWTVWARSSVIIFMAVFVAAGLAKWTIILFGVVDLLAAIWTGLALRQSKAAE